MKKIQILAATLLMAISISAQKTTDFGPLNKISRGYLPQILGENEDELYGVSYEDEVITIETFDKESLSSTSYREIEIEELRGTAEDLERLSFINGKVVYFTSLKSFRDQTYELIMQTIDPETGEVSEKQSICEASLSYSKIYTNIFISKNRKKILVRFFVNNFETGQIVERLMLYNEDLELITEREYTESAKGINRNSGLVVDDEGSVYFIQSNEVVILDAFNEFEEWREELPVDDLEVGAYYSQISITLNKDMDPVITAYYVTKDLKDLDRKKVNKARKDRAEGDTQVEGVVFFKINSLDKELEVAKHTIFKQDYIEMFENKEDRKRNYDPEIQNEYNINRIISLKNGETLLLGEIYRTRLSGFFFRSKKTELYGDMMLIHFSSDGEILWKDRLPKAQMYYSTNGYLFTNGGSAGLNFWVYPKGIKDYFYDKVIVDEEAEKVYLVYNDSPKNQGSNSVKRDQVLFKKFRKGVPVVQTIDLKKGARNGEIERSLTKPEFWMKANSMFLSELNDDVFYFITYKRKMHLARTSFK
jgi:hypothetical protein